MTYQCKQVDIGDKCIECLRSTSFGTGLFVNRLPADNDKYIGYLCPECNFQECDRCNEKIYVDDDCTPYDVYLDHEPSEFKDGAASFAPRATIGFASGGTGCNKTKPSLTVRTRLQSFANVAGSLNVPIGGRNCVQNCPVSAFKSSTAPSARVTNMELQTLDGCKTVAKDGANSKCCESIPTTAAPLPRALLTMTSANF